MPGKHSAFQALGTNWRIQVDEPVSGNAWPALLSRIHARIEAFDAAYSRFRIDSLVTAMSKKAGVYELPADGYPMLQFYERLYQATGGKVTPLIGQVVADAGYDADYSLKQKTLVSPPKWEEILSYNRRAVTLARPALLDFGAAGKGCLVDIVSGIIQGAGIGDYLVDASGDILHRSTSQKPTEVGLENPQDTSEAIGIAHLSNMSLCASAGSKRAWGMFHHIIDPATLRSPRDVRATWVLADDTMTADGLATALFFTPASVLQETYSFSYALLDSEMNLYHTDGFPITTFAAA